MNQGQAALQIAPSPHVFAPGVATTRMMVDVVLALVPVVAMAIYVFQWFAVLQLSLCLLSCLAAEAIFTRMRGRGSSLGDFSAAVTGVILGLSLPWSAPWYVSVLASVVAIGLGKILFGGLGQNLFNPAMVGRAFVMISFPAALGAAAYVNSSETLRVVTQATPLTAAKQMGVLTELWPLCVGTVNGSLGETSAIAALVGGLYLCFRRAAAWQIPAGTLLTVVILAGVGNLINPVNSMTVAHHLFGGSLLFGAFFIATDPVTSPLTPLGRFLFGMGIGALVLILRVFSGYPEGLMFAVLLMNAVVPLINRWTIPRPVGSRVAG